MKCLNCGYTESKVIDSRSTDDNNCIRRRRECLQCGKRFTTYETIESTPLLVIKNDNSRQIYDRNKIKRGIIKACEKCNVTMYQIDAIVDDIEREINKGVEQEVKSSLIGEMVMQRLKNLDEVAYIRFASVYRKFKDITNFKNFIKDI